MSDGELRQAGKRWWIKVAWRQGGSNERRLFETDGQGINRCARIVGEEEEE